MSQLIVNAALAGATYALVASGFNVAFRVLGYYYILFGGAIAAAAVATHAAVVGAGLPWSVGVPLGLGVAVLVALADFFLVYRPLLSRNATGLTLFLASTAAYFIVTNLLLVIAGPGARAFSRAGRGVLSFAGANLPITGLWLVIGAIGLWLLLFVGFRKTRIGMAMRAVADNDEMAAIVGIPVMQTRLTAILVAAGIAGVAGILVGLNQSIRVDMGMPLLLKGILASVIAGLGNVSLAALAGFLVGLLEVVIVAALPSGMKDIFLFALLALLLVLRPYGLLSAGFRRA